MTFGHGGGPFSTKDDIRRTRQVAEDRRTGRGTSASRDASVFSWLVLVIVVVFGILAYAGTR